VLVALSVVEQRLDAVRLVLAGVTVTEVAARVGVSRQTLHCWLSRYLAQGWPGWLIGRGGRTRARVGAVVMSRLWWWRCGESIRVGVLSGSGCSL
jgi:transposase